MPTYTYPEMPLRMNVWLETTEVPPAAAPSLEDVPCSCSPISPDQFNWGRINTGLYHHWSHIIRCQVIPGLADNYLRGDEADLWPCSAFEIPAGSGHFYLALWCHIAGAGFANEHERVYASRYNLGDNASRPWFVGWI